MSIEVSIRGFEEAPAKDGSESHVNYQIVVSIRGPIASTDSGKGKASAPSEIINSWTVKRRFNDFYDLHTSLKSQGYKNILAFNFPPRSASILQSKLSLASNRRQILEQYLREILHMSTIPPEFLTFLEIDMRSHDSIPTHMTDQQMKESPMVSPTVRESVNDVLSYLNPVNVISTLTNKIQSPKAKIKATLEDSKLEEKLYGIFNIPLRDEDRHRLVLSLFSIAVVVVLSSALSIIVAVWTPIKSIKVILSYLYHVLIGLRVGLEAAIIVVVMVMTVHRLFGHIMTQYLQSKLLAPDGSYNITIDWISVRLGLDRNEIIFHGLTFHNPSQFQHTPYLIRIDEMSFTVDIFSVVDIFIFGNKRRSIRIYMLELDGIDFYIEKGFRRSDGMNLWAALGAANKDQEKDVQDYVFQAISTASNIALPFASLFSMSAWTKHPKHDDHDSQSSETRQLESSPSVQSPSPMASSQSNPRSALFGNFSSNLPSTQRGHDDENASATELKYPSIYYDASGNSGDEDDAQKSIWRDIPSEEEEETDPNVSATSTSADDQPDEIPPSDSSDKKGWGVPYIFEVDRLTVHSFKLHAQDFLTAHHVDTKTAAYIEIDVINMHRRELTKPAPKKSANQRRQGLYLDQLTWRLVYRTVVELFRTNQMSMMSIVAAATVNQTTNAVLDVAQMASQGVSNAVYNYNPIQILQSTRKNIQKAIAAKENITRSPSISLLDVSSMKVRIIKLRDVITADGKAPKIMKCMMRLKGCILAKGGGADDEGNTELMKSSALSKNRENEIAYNETFFLQPLTSLDCIMHLRVYEAGLLGKNVFACEMYLPIRQALVSGTRNLVKSTSKAPISPAAAPGSTEESASIGVKDEVVAWHNLYGRDEHQSSKLGEIRLGLSLV